MKSLFRASILGLGHSEVVYLREHITTILLGAQVEWVAANHAHLDFLIVNSNFINASSVQNLLRSNALPVLLTTHASDISSEKNTIQLPLIDNSLLKKWIHESVLNDKKQSPNPIKTQDYVITQVLLNNTKIFEYLRSNHVGLLYLSDSCGAVGMIDTTHQQVYLLPERRVPIDMQGQLLYEPVNHLPKSYQSVDLLQWLWDVVWSAPSCALYVSPSQLVRLKFWPQPSRQTDRKDVLLMTAKLAQGVISAQDIADHLKIPVARVQHFMSALVMAGFGDLQNELPTAPSLPKKVTNTEEAKGLRRLLQGMRRRFGL